MVYADGSNPSVRKDIGVRLPSPAQRFPSQTRDPGGVRTPFANGLLTGFSAGAEDDAGDPIRGGPMQPLGDVAVDVEGDRHVGVSEPLLDDLGMQAGRQRERCPGVPKVVQPDPRQTRPGRLMLERPLAGRPSTARSQAHRAALTALPGRAGEASFGRLRLPERIEGAGADRTGEDGTGQDPVCAEDVARQVTRSGLGVNAGALVTYAKSQRSSRSAPMTWLRWARATMIKLRQGSGGGVGLGFVDILETHRSRPKLSRNMITVVMTASTRRATRRVPHPLRRSWPNFCVGGCCGGG
jgi:hypothetical protein